MANYSAITADVCTVYVDMLSNTHSKVKTTRYDVLFAHSPVRRNQDAVLSTTALRNMFAPQYCQDTVLRMEVAILNELDWNLGRDDLHS